MGKRKGRELTAGPAMLTQPTGATLGPTGIEFDENVPFEQWQEIGQFLQRAEGAVQWWIGDWVIHGEKRSEWGERAKEAAERFSRQDKSVETYKYVAENVRSPTRVGNLTWHHHKLVAPLRAPAQRKWLKRAEKGDGEKPWSVAELKKQLRAEKIAADLEANPLPDGTYRVIYADPPWKYSDELIDGYGAAEHHYRTLTIEELCELHDARQKTVKDVVQPDAVLFLWVTSPLLEDAFEIIEAWGFEYKTSFVWDKVQHNYGHYNSVRHEILLVCTRGSCTPDGGELVDSVVEVDRSEVHSQKPDRFYEIIESMYTRGPYLELFARQERTGWDAWGNEVEVGDRDGS